MQRKISNNVHKISFRNETQCCFSQFCMILVLVISTIYLLSKCYAKTFSEIESMWTCSASVWKRLFFIDKTKNDSNWDNQKWDNLVCAEYVAKKTRKPINGSQPIRYIHSTYVSAINNLVQIWFISLSGPVVRRSTSFKVPMKRNFLLAICDWKICKSNRWCYYPKSSIKGNSLRRSDHPWWRH